MGATNNATSSPGRVILVPVRAFSRIDRSSGLVLVAVAALTLAGILAVLLSQASAVAADSTTPRGVVTIYVRAIQAGDADRAWNLLSQTATAPAPGEPRPIFSRDEFRQQVQSYRGPTPPGVRIVTVSESNDTATVQLDVRHASANPLTGVTTQQATLSLARQAGSWLITSDPSPWAFQ